MSQADNSSTGDQTSRDFDNWEHKDPDIEREITLEEFQPYGTLTLVLLYFAIVVLMWIFMYFVEFAGNDPSIIN